MISESVFKNRYSCDESRNLPDKWLWRCYNSGGYRLCRKRRLLISLRKSTFILVNPYVHRHFERWQGNWIHREPQATENPMTRFPSGGSIPHENTVKITTASRSPEIFFVIGNTGLFNRLSPAVNQCQQYLLLNSKKLLEFYPQFIIHNSPFIIIFCKTKKLKAFALSF